MVRPLLLFFFYGGHLFLRGDIVSQENEFGGQNFLGKIVEGDRFSGGTKFPPTLEPLGGQRYAYRRQLARTLPSGYHYRLYMVDTGPLA